MSVFTLHRYYIWADRMRTHFDELISNGDFDKAAEIESFLYMSYWYGGLYVVIEGWQELSLSDAVIDATLQSPNVQLLRRYRNGVFHFKKDYYDERFLAFMKEGNDSVSWVRSLNSQFDLYFLEFFTNQRQLRLAYVRGLHHERSASSRVDPARNMRRFYRLDIQPTQ